MKLKIAIVVCLGMCGFGQLSFGQTSAVPQGHNATTQETQTPVQPLENGTPSPPTLPVDGAPVARSNQPVPAPEVIIPLSNGAAHAAPEPPNPGADERGPLTLDHELPAAISFLARMAGINMHFDPSVSFTNNIPMVSLRWENVTARDALREVLDVHGLMMVENPRTQINRVVKKPTVDPLVTAIVQLKYSTPSNMVELIQTTFADPGRSRVRADQRTSQLLILSTQRELDSITNMLAQLDSPTKQVLIEARMLETSKNPKSIKGIDWSGTLEGQNFTFGNGFTSGTTTTHVPGAPTTTTLPSGRTVTGSTKSSTKTELTTQLGAGGISMDTARGFHPSTAFLNADGVRAVLSFLNSDADTEVVATPRQVTADNVTATLSVTRAFPIFEITPGSAQNPPTAKITYTNLGTILKVTPRIAAQSNIVLKVIPEVSNIDSKDRQIINGDVNEANVYAIRRMETEVLIPTGHTLVMGGLISDTTSKSYTKVPVLGDLPGIGLAFRRDAKARNKSNLLIFVTPTIVRMEDFTPTPTEFLRTRPVDKPDREETAWNRGKPYDWKKGK